MEKFGGKNQMEKITKFDTLMLIYPWENRNILWTFLIGAGRIISTL